MTSYRTGNKNARNIYRVADDGTETHIGCMFTEEDGKAAAVAMTTAAVLKNENAFLRDRVDRPTAGFTGSCPRCGLRDAEGDDGTLCAPCDAEVTTEGDRE